MSRVSRYFDVLGSALQRTQVSTRDGETLTLPEAIEALGKRARQTHEAGGKLMFIGNGGSAGICSHMAIDYTKNGGIRSMAFNDGAALTCLANDLGYENVFAHQVDMHARKGDMLIAISSSGESPNIIKAADIARERGCYVLTLSGFKPGNALRSFGDCNLYVESGEYGFVEIAHMALCHAILDLEMGWGSNAATEKEEQRTPILAA